VGERRDAVDLLPEALLATIDGGTIATASLCRRRLVSVNAAFGSLGVTLTLVGVMLILIVLSMVCPVFSSGPSGDTPKASANRPPPDKPG
jgi:hypothetical protein